MDTPRTVSVHFLDDLHEAVNADNVAADLDAAEELWFAQGGCGGIGALGVREIRASERIKRWIPGPPLLP